MFRKPSCLYLPISFAYHSVVSLRNLLFDLDVFKQYRSRLPVISVGNIVVGGSGKTPFTTYLANFLQSSGHKPVILSRGYGGKDRGPTIVKGNSTPLEVGDEAVMQFDRFKGQIPIIVSHSRVKGAKFIEKLNLGNVILLDDGFQHRWLYRDADILLIDGLEYSSIVLGNELFLPAGRLRESFSAAEKRAQVVVRVWRLIDDYLKFKSLKEFKTKLTTYDVLLEVLDPVDVFTDEVVTWSQVSSLRSIVAVSAIAKPKAFVDTLKRNGLQIEKEICFPDHYQYTEKDWNSINEDTHSIIFTTAKDVVKLRQFVKCPGKVFVVNARYRFVDQSLEEMFWQGISINS